MFLQDLYTRCILHLISGSGTIVCTLYLTMHVLILLHNVLTMSNLSLNASALLYSDDHIISAVTIDT